jgi:phosphatidylserine decarboxylase
MRKLAHQYVDRETRQIRTERLFQDRLIRFLYSSARESAPALFRALTSGRASKLLGYVNYDLPLGAKLVGSRRFMKKLGVDLSECLDPPKRLNTPRKVFERKIRYWECREMPADGSTVVSPADARVLVGSFTETHAIPAKDKFFRYEELLGVDKRLWLDAFEGGDFAIFRLTPDKYHWNHTPVSGIVVDIYEVDGTYHSCNPQAVVAVATPYSKNKRVVTIIDTDVPGGTGVGLVAMIEVVALMIGHIDQRYCEERYDLPQPVEVGLFLRRGQPKSLYRPGSSTDILIFQPNRIEFAADLLSNMNLPLESRFSRGFGRALVETDIRVRSYLAHRS